MAIFTKAQTAARWLSGPAIRIGFLRNIFMNLMSTWFVLVVSIRQYWMAKSLFLIPGTSYLFRRGQNSVESVLRERELFMRLEGNGFRELKSNGTFNSQFSIGFLISFHNLYLKMKVFENLIYTFKFCFHYHNC